MSNDTTVFRASDSPFHRQLYIMLALWKDGLYVDGQERHCRIDFTAEEIEDIDFDAFDWPRIYEAIEKDGLYSVPVARYEAGEIDIEEMEKEVWAAFRRFVRRGRGSSTHWTSVALN